MSFERPDFSVDSQGNARMERAVQLLADIDLPKLFNAAGRKGNRNSEAFIDELADLLRESGLVDDGEVLKPTFRHVAEPLLNQEEVAWETFTKAVRASWRSKHD